MPELPEVETVCQSLREFIVGETITTVESLHPKSFFALPNYDLVDSQISAISRRGKFIIIHLDKKSEQSPHFLVTHLKMTGQLLYRGQDQRLAGGGHPRSDTLEQLPGKHTRIIYTLTRGQLFFNDLRIFGWMKTMDEAMLQNTLSTLGSDANDPNLDVNLLYEKLHRKSIPIKQSLMDNALLTGIGNIYASEILFICGVNPTTPSNKITLQKLQEIVKVAREILNEAIKYGGTTFDGRYVDALGRAGNFEEKLQVYGRAGEKCKKCGGTLENIKLGGRSSVYCPNCQK